MYPSIIRWVTANPRVVHRNLRSSRLDVFDKQHVIALLAVNEIADEMLCQQKPEATCAKTSLQSQHSLDENHIYSVRQYLAWQPIQSGQLNKSCRSARIKTHLLQQARQKRRLRGPGKPELFAGQSRAAFRLLRKFSKEGHRSTGNVFDRRLRVSEEDLWQRQK